MSAAEAVIIGGADEKRSKAIWARACAATAYAPPQPFSTLGHQLTTAQVLAYLLKRSGMPRWLIGHYLRVWDDDIAAHLRAVEAARTDPPLAVWLDELAGPMPRFKPAAPSALRTVESAS